MEYLDGSKITIGDLVFWNDEERVGYISEVVEDRGLGNYNYLPGSGVFIRINEPSLLSEPIQSFFVEEAKFRDLGVHRPTPDELCEISKVKNLIRERILQGRVLSYAIYRSKKGERWSADVFSQGRIVESFTINTGDATICSK